MEKQDLNLMIIWENARSSQDKILSDLSDNFSLCECFDIGWTKELFHNNLTRFYGQKLPNGSFKEKHCGNGRFLLVIFIDNNPNYTYRTTSKGEELVNTNIFDKKNLYREWTGGGHKIHATNGEHEINHDLMLLLGVDAESYLQKIQTLSKKNNLTITPLDKDLEGASEWSSFEHLFKTLNACINYVVMRNYENLPNAYQVDEHGDIDFLSDDMQEMVCLINGEPKNRLFRPNAFDIKVNKELIPCDVRSVGDGYYDETWQQDILSNTEYKRGFKVPSQKNFIAMLVYHALIHKVRLSNSYNTIFQQESLPLTQLHSWLEKFMNENSYQIELPMDISVYFNYSNRNLLNVNIKHSPLQKRILRKIRQWFLVDFRLLTKRIITKGRHSFGDS